MFLPLGVGLETTAMGGLVMGAHVDAVEESIAAAGLGPVDAPLVQLVRTLAVQMDGAGAGGPGTRLVGSYLTAVRTLTARAAAVRPVPAVPPAAAELVVAKEVPGGDVLDFRERARQRRQAG